MRSNKTVGQTVRVKMKQQQHQSSKKKATSKTQSPKDSISETISFVIKGKLTPIKQTTKNAKKMSKTSEKTKNCSSIRSATLSDKGGAKKTVESKLIQKTAPTKRIARKKSTKKLRNETESAVRTKVKKFQKKEPKAKTTVATGGKAVFSNRNEKDDDDDDMKKKRTIAKLLKQVNQVLKRKTVCKGKTAKPKNAKMKLVKKTVKDRKVTGPSNANDSLNREKCLEKRPPTFQGSKIAKEDSSCSSDDNNLEEIRRKLQMSTKKNTVRKNCDKNGTLNKKMTKVVAKKRKVIANKVKTAPSNLVEDNRMRKMRLFGFWNGPKRQRVASLNALAKVHCLYENEGKINLLDNPPETVLSVKKELLLVDLIDDAKFEQTTSSTPPQRNLRRVPGLRGVGKHWDMHATSSSSSSDENSSDECETSTAEVTRKEPKKKLEEQKKRKRKQAEIVMDLKDMVVRKRMASLNATAILAASYCQEKRRRHHHHHPKSPETDTNETSDDENSCDDEQERKKKCYADDVKKEDNNSSNASLIGEVRATKPNKKKVAVILNQDTDVTITGVYVNSTTRSTHHEGYCSIAGMQYRISATSHTQTAATAVATETLLQSTNSSASQENTSSDSSTPVVGKSYKPLDALSNMRPPSDGTHRASLGPAQHLIGIVPSSGVRHSCTSAFSAPHVNSYHHGGTSAPPSESGHVHGYYQPAGPLITVPLGHGQPPLTKSAPLSETSPTPSPLNSHQHPPSTHRPAPSSNGGDSSDSEVIITSVTAGKDAPPAHNTFGRYSQQQQQQHQYHPNLQPQNYSAYPHSPPYYHSTPPPTSYPAHEMCYHPYIHHKFPSPVTAYGRFMRGTPYYPPNANQDIYAVPPTSHGQPSQQVVTTTPAPGTGSFRTPSTLLEPYPPTIVEAYPTHYYPGYHHPPGPPSACYSHAPPSRAVPFLNGVYQNCPCPMQSCPKNGLTGPLTGESKRSDTLTKGGSVQPLPPVALALPKEPSSDGPPSPARGSAGMPPPPSPAGATLAFQPAAATFAAMPPVATTKQENSTCEIEVPNKNQQRKARVGKAMVRNNIQNTMLLMCNPLPNVDCVKREIESPKEKDNREEEIERVQQKENEAKPLLIDEENQTSIKTENEHVSHESLESPKLDGEKLEPVISTVAENVKVKNMKRSSSLSVERKEEAAVPFKRLKLKSETGCSYKNLIKRNTNSITIINNGKRKLMEEIQNQKSSCPRKNVQRKRHLLNDSIEVKKGKLKLINECNNNNGDDDEDGPVVVEEIVETKGNSKRSGAKHNQKLKPADKLLRNSIDRTIDCVINDAKLRTNNANNNSVVLTKKNENSSKCAKQPQVIISARKSAKNPTKRKKSKCKDAREVSTSSVTIRSKPTLKWSNGWSWEGEPYEAKVFLNSDETTVIRRCYPSMRHHSGDLIQVRDCVLLKSGARRNELPFVAKIASLWENPEDGEMMMSLLWFYRPEHTEQGRQSADQPDEVFASRHKDSNSVACIDDKCYVLTFNEYCRYRKNLRRQEEGIENDAEVGIIPVPEPYPRSHRQPPPDTKISAEMIFFCRRVYDFRQKRIVKNPT